ncbi:transcriptional regulator NarP [compost metagenome]
MMQPIRVLNVDDHRHAREGMKVILSSNPIFELVGEAESGVEAIQLTDIGCRI